MKGNETSHAGEPASTPLQSQTNPPDHILVVEDDIFFRRLNTEVLLRSGYEVDTAADGAAAWEALQANRYNLLITEHEMPNLTGVELVKKLRAARMALPVVMAAGRLPTEELARNPSLQLAATLLKAFAVDALLDTVKNVLRATDSAREQIELLPIWRSQPSADGLWL
jgi:DNA-binding response OmpR family regulator